MFDTNINNNHRNRYYHYRWERIVVAVDDNNNEDDDADTDMIQYIKPLIMHVRLESSTTGQISKSSSSSSSQTISSLFISQHIIDLFTIISSKVDKSSLSSLSNCKTTSRQNKLTHTHTQQDIHEIQILHLHIQASNIASQSYPTSSSTTTTTTTVSSILNGPTHNDITGPSGILVQVDFSITTECNAIQCYYNILKTSKNYFLKFILPYISGSRRIMIAPILTSIQNQRLHRYIHCYPIQEVNYDSYKRQYLHSIQCTTMIPLDGAHTSFSMEGFRTFLQQQPSSSPTSNRLKRHRSTNNNNNNNGINSSNGGIWNNIASPRTWSHYFIGSGHSIPQSIVDATQSFSDPTNPKINTNRNNNNIYRKQLVNRRMYWMDWKVITDHDSNKNSTDGPFSIEARYGIQYTIQLSSSPTTTTTTIVNGKIQEQYNISLNDILPNDENHMHQFYQADPYADLSTIEFLHAPNINNNTTYEWGSACQRKSGISKEQKERRHMDDNPNKEYQQSTTMIRSINAFESVSRTEPCLLIRTEQNSKHDENKSTIMNHHATTNIISSYWSVQTHIWRPYAGQTNRGTYNGIIQNQLPYCGTYIQVQQFIPAIIEPIWQSLHVRITARSHLQEQNESSIVVLWHQLDDYHVDFQSDGSFMINLQHAIPPLSKFDLLFDYQSKLINIDHFPADANRGFELPPMIAQFRIELDGSDSCHTILQQTIQNQYNFHNPSSIVTLYSNVVLILAPLPDMSMPFNVLSLTCTFYVFVIGSLLNIFLKKISIQMKNKILQPKQKQSPIQKLKSFVQTIRNKVFNSKNEQKEKSE